MRSLQYELCIAKYALSSAVLTTYEISHPVRMFLCSYCLLYVYCIYLLLECKLYVPRARDTSNLHEHLLKLIMARSYITHHLHLQSCFLLRIWAVHPTARRIKKPGESHLML